MRPYYLLFILITLSCKNKVESPLQVTTQLDTITQNSSTIDKVEDPVNADTIIQAPVEVSKPDATISKPKPEKPKLPASSTVKKSKPNTVVPSTKEIKVSSGTKNIQEPSKPTYKEGPGSGLGQGSSGKPDRAPVQPEVIKSTIPVEKPSDAKPEHAPWHSLLQKYVSVSGKVNYAAWKKDRSGLDNYIKSIGSIDLNKLGYKEKLAYCINSYNAHTVQLVLDNYPTSSIQKLEGGKPWDKRFVKSGNTYYSLNELENKIIRPMGDARIHFALNCGAKSCPKLANQAFTADNVTTLLEKVTRDFVNSPETKISKDKVTISKVFEWYKADFDDVIAFLQKYTSVKINPDAKIAYTDYNWSLNE